MYPTVGPNKREELQIIIIVRQTEKLIKIKLFEVIQPWQKYALRIKGDKLVAIYFTICIQADSGFVIFGMIYTIANNVRFKTFP